jgi:hypothetical protein
VVAVELDALEWSLKQRAPPVATIAGRHEVIAYIALKEYRAAGEW